LILCQLLGLLADLACQYLPSFGIQRLPLLPVPKGAFALASLLKLRRCRFRSESQDQESATVVVPLTRTMVSRMLGCDVDGMSASVFCVVRRHTSGLRLRLHSGTTRHKRQLFFLLIRQKSLKTKVHYGAMAEWLGRVAKPRTTRFIFGFAPPVSRTEKRSADVSLANNPVG